MGYTKFQEISSDSNARSQTPPKQKRWVHIVLFLFTALTTLAAGAQWYNVGLDQWETWMQAITYMLLLMTFISAHEFGHYFAARYHKVDATLPYFIPFPFVTLNPFGTMGAVIRTRSAILSRKVLFDIGVAGPLAGFVVCIVILAVGYATLPTIAYLDAIHPGYPNIQVDPSMPVMYFGESIMNTIMTTVFANPNGYLPPMSEIYHYPFLCVGWFGLFVTALNLLPVGQLDGGHVVYAMFGARVQNIVARAVFVIMLLMGIGTVVGLLEIFLFEENPDSLFTFLQEMTIPIVKVFHQYVPWLLEAWGGWFFWAFFLRFFVGLRHPPIQDNEQLDTKRNIVGWIAIAVLVVSISYRGIYAENLDSDDPRIDRHKTVVQSSYSKPTNEYVLHP